MAVTARKSSPIASQAKPTMFGAHLPFYTLSQSPLACISYWSELFQYRHQLAKLSRAVPRFHIFAFLGWECESTDRLQQMGREYADIRRSLGGATVHVLANSPKEEKGLRRFGIDAFHCHQNAFLDYNRYGVLSYPQKYSCVILSRITPFKRLELAAELRNYLLIGRWSARESDYGKQVMANLQGVSWKKKVYSFRIQHQFNRARCGVILSGVEGANFVSTEYLLCGLPVVSTPSIGGRDVFFSPDNAVIVDPAADAVRNAVENIRTDWDRQGIRQQTIRRMQHFRHRLQEKIRQVCDTPAFDLDDVFVHKFLLRSGLASRLSRHRHRLLRN